MSHTSEEKKEVVPPSLPPPPTTQIPEIEIKVAKPVEVKPLTSGAYVIDGEVFTIYYDCKVIGVGPGAKIEPYLDKVLMGEATGYVSEVTAANYFYDLCQRFGLEEAKSRMKQIRESRCIFVPPDEKISTKAALLLCQHGDKLSLADAFLVATAQEKGATIITTSEAVRDVAGAVGVEVIYVKVGA